VRKQKKTEDREERNIKKKKRKGEKHRERFLGGVDRERKKTG
jgi:hypothetical protein